MPSLDEAAQRLAALLTGDGRTITDATGRDLEFFAEVAPVPLAPQAAPTDCWAVDGGQALVADARTVTVYATRAARVRWSDGRASVEEATPLVAHLLSGSGGGYEGRRSVAELGAPVHPEAPVDVNLLRDWTEWQLVNECVSECAPGGAVLVDGDLQPDWRIPAAWLADLLERASVAKVVLVGITKHSSLARGGAPLVGQLETEAARTIGPRSTWWAPVAVRRPEVGPGLLVTVARLDPDARFAFRVDLPADADPAQVLGSLCPLADDAGFPGYPYPLSIADRLAACPGWARDELRSELEAVMALAGVPDEIVERALADRHRLMERA
ncbi:MAG TPA: DNA double-strand break repair nuclease NurA [Acidimicrobiales bacterium]|nr:DNA double-strand break repair nuclease NurA [Acidimicrobiales bacterium]